MEHETQPTSEQSQSEVMPCHYDINNNGIDLCDCDSCVQFLYSVTSIQFPVNLISAESFNRLQYTSLDLNLNYRPPIKFST